MGFRRHLRRIRRVLLGLALALGIVAGLGAYLTRGSVLRAHLDAALAPAGLTVTSVGALSYSPWGGLRAVDLIVDRAAYADPARGAPPLLRVGSARLELGVWALFAGQIEARRLSLDRATLSLVVADRAASGTSDAERAAGARIPRADDVVGTLGVLVERLPEIAVRDGDVQVFACAGGSLRLLRRWIVRCEGAPVVQDGAPREYALNLTQIGGPTALHAAPRDAADARTLATLRLRDQGLIASSGWLDIDTLAAVAPLDVVRLLNDLRVRGACRVQSLRLDGARVSELDLRVRSLDFDANAEGGDIPAQQRYLQVRGAEGRLRFADRAEEARRGDLFCGDATLELAGTVHDAQCRIDARIERLAYGPGGDAAGDPGEYALRSSSLAIDVDVRALTLPSPAEHPAFLAHTSHVPGALRAFIKDYRATGQANVRLSYVLDGDVFADAEGTERFDGVFEPLGAQCRYFRFPYTVDDVRGRVEFSDRGIDLCGLTGRHGLAQITATGHVNNSDSWTGFDLQFTSLATPLDKALFDAIPRDYRNLWAQADPIGLADLAIRLRRPDGDESHTPDADVEIDAHLRSASLTLGRDVRLHRAAGRIVIRGDRVVVEDLVGQHGEATIRVAGTIDASDAGDVASQSLRIQASNVQLDVREPLRPAEAEQSLGEVRLRARADAWGHVMRDDAGPRESYTVRLRDGTLTGFDPSGGWDVVDGLVVLDGQRREIRSLTASRNGSLIDLSGVLPSADGGQTRAQCAVRASAEDADWLARQLIPPAYDDLRAALNVRGAAEAQLLFGDGSAPQPLTAVVRLDHLTLLAIPIPLRDVAARAAFRAESFVLDEFTARDQAGATYQLALRGDRTSVEGRLNAGNVSISPEFVRVLPADLRGVLESLSLRGQADLALDECVLKDAGRGGWEARGTLVLRDAAMDIGLPLERFSGAVNGGCVADGEGRLALDAEFHLHDGRLDGRTIADCTGRLERSPDERRLRIERIRAAFCGGQLVGFGDVDPVTREFQLSLTLVDVCFGEFRGVNPDSGGPMRRGRLDGQMFVRGIGGDTARRVGGGVVRIRGTSLLSSPVTAGVVEASRRARRALDEDVEQAEIRFVWDAGEMRFTRVDIHSKNTRLVGEGRWNSRDDSIDLTLVAAPPPGAPRVVGLSDLLDAAGQELIQYRIEGAASAPRVRAEPLRSLTEPLRALLRGE